ncbi:MAG: hypothetical protein Q8Q36_02640 [bacterium]|nr:hypothetical protein [bacterium]
MPEIIPALMPKTIEELRDKLALVRGAARYVQLDTMDGKFVPNVSFPYEAKGKLGQMPGELPFWEDFNFEFDLMVEHPEETVGAFLSLGASRIVLHAESSEAHLLLRAIDEIRNFDCEAGIAAGNDTPLSALEPFLYRVNFAQIMGIRRVGFQGEPFDARAISRIQELRAKYPELSISVDGGVNLETISYLAEAGADHFVVGSAVFDVGDAKGAIEALAQAMQ